MIPEPLPEVAKSIVEYTVWLPVYTHSESIVLLADWCSFERKAMLAYDMTFLPDDVRGYLECEAARRGTDIDTIYQEELAAEMRNQTKAASPELLERLARESNPDPRRLAEGEAYPF